MTSISFDNPYLLLIAIPLLALLIVPYIIAIRKENKSKSTITTLLLHTVMIALVALAFAGLQKITVKTETEVLIVADVSYSTNSNIDKTDSYIKELIKKENLPANTKVGVVCFGRDYAVNTVFGGEFSSVKNSLVDTSATDIVSALNYASTLFSNNTIKRIVLITDGKETLTTETSRIVSAIGNLESQDIYVDAIYLDSNIKDDEYEVQINSVEFVSSTYLNHKTSLQVLIQSNTDYIPNEENQKDRNDAFIRLYDETGEIKVEVSKPLHKGFNLISIDLDTSVGGVKDYKVTVDASHDTSPHNNEFSFTQTVNEKIKVLLVSKTSSDLTRAEELYGESAEIYAPLLLKRKEPVPYSIEELCKYDEFILSSVDIKEIENASAFISNLDIVVSKFGKSLITAGNTFVQNQDNDLYSAFKDMMAIQYGNTSGEPKLYGIVIDSSRSMQDAYQLIMAKQSAIELLNTMSPQDYVAVFSVSGDASMKLMPTSVAHKETIIQAINSIQPTQGTVLGAGLKLAKDMMENQTFYQKHAILISDGRTYLAVDQKDNPINVVSEMRKSGIIVSTINTNSVVGQDLLKQIATAGRGNYYFVETPEDVTEVVSTEIADDITETVVEGDIPVIIETYDDPIINGLLELPNIGGYYFGVTKSNATTVLNVEYRFPTGDTALVPLYSYWNYGNGRVASLSTAFSGKWVDSWYNDPSGTAVLTGLLTTNTPKERLDYPFNIGVSVENTGAVLEVIPAENNPDVIVDVKITSPSGKETTARLYYEKGLYQLPFEVGETGKYDVSVNYIFGEEIFEGATSFNISYLSEYNRFDLFDSATLYNSVGNNGNVSENGSIKIENDESEIETYVYYFTIPLMVTAVVLFVIDIIIRKLKWNDIKSFFKKSKTGGKAQ